MKNRNISNYVMTILTGIVLMVLVGIHVCVNIFHYCTRLDADLASEALLMTVIADNGLRMPDTWASSSGVRIISSPNIGAIIYKLTGDMYLSIGLACIFLMIILVVFMIIYYRQIGFKWYEVFSSIILLFSVSNVESENQSVLFLWAAYYSIYFISLYVMLIFYNHSMKTEKVAIGIWVSSILLAILNGMEGLHAGLYCYFPILGVEIVRRAWELFHKEKEKNGIIIWLACSATVSVMVPLLFDAFGSDSGRNIRHAGEKFIEQVLPAMGQVVYFGIAPTVVWCICVLAVIGYGVVVLKVLKKNEIGEQNQLSNFEKKMLWGSLAPLVVIALVVVALTFTVREVAPRYFFPELFALATGIGLFMHYFRQGEANSNKASVLVSLIVVMLGILASRYYYTELIKNDYSDNTAESHVATWMKDNGYECGYAIFDNANTITVISNNTVKVRAVNNMYEMKGCKWLSDASWYPPTKSTEGKTCYLVSESARGDFEKFLKERNPLIVDICDVDRYTVYVLDHDYTVWID